MSKALTSLNRKFKGDLDSEPQRISDWQRRGQIPSYFGNFGIFNLHLMLRMQARVTKRRLCQKHVFPVITAIMAIV
jgi:hypothetical protein